MNLPYVAKFGALGLLVALLVWAGLKQSPTVSSAPPAPTKLPAVAERPKAPDFTLASVSGEKFSLSSLEGKAPVIVNFFATT